MRLRLPHRLVGDECSYGTKPYRKLYLSENDGPRDDPSLAHGQTASGWAIRRRVPTGCDMRLPVAQFRPEGIRAEATCKKLTLILYVNSGISEGAGRVFRIGLMARVARWGRKSVVEIIFAVAEVGADTH